ncbi:unnamed protein product [Moneuplotes crassus]|uniref:Mitochondrial import inner membrane translocase subunit n=1 Tax=Euplotes crassus TaxID=5936 RepID=A0AAD1Y2I0_EUPCR|nr:unnamed protein product [Moneuplotes crassus]
MLSNHQEDIDKQNKELDERFNRRQVGKVYKAFYDKLKDSYTENKFQQGVTMYCAQKCLYEFTKDGLNPREDNCLNACYNKGIRMSILMNTLYVKGKQGKFTKSDDDEDDSTSDEHVKTIEAVKNTLKSVNKPRR